MNLSLSTPLRKSPIRFMTRLARLLSVGPALLACASSAAVAAAPKDESAQTPGPALLRWSTAAPLPPVYDAVYKALEDAGFYVVFEANLGKNFERMREKWGDETNRNQLAEIRSMVFCNARLANQVINADPDLVAVCPLHLGLFEKDGVTELRFALPSAAVQSSPGLAAVRKVEAAVRAAVDKGLAQAQASPAAGD